MELQPVALGDAADALGSYDHGDIEFARQDRRVTEPPADLADETASPAEVGQPRRIDHCRNDDVAVAEALDRIAELGVLFRDHAGSSFDNLAAGHPDATNGVGATFL